MIPTIAANGSSFKGAAAYYLHDKDADTRDRVAWTHTENLVTSNADKAWKVMAWTANNQATLKARAGGSATGRKLQKPVFAFSVAWHPEQRPDKAHMLAAAKEAVAALGLSEHQALYVAHNDEPQPHVHIVINRVHPGNGIADPLSNSKKLLSKWALAYEKQHGKVYCKAREKTRERKAEPKSSRAGNPVIQAAWEKSDCGHSFQAALAAENYTLAWGNKRFVVVDRWGKAVNPVRHLGGVRASVFNARLQDIDRHTLPLATMVQRQIKVQERKQYHASRKFDRWSAQYLNQMQERQLDERAKLQIRYEQKRDEKAWELAAYYKTKEREKVIQALEQKIENSGFLRRLFGGVKRDKAELADRKWELEHVQQRTREELNAIQSEKEYALSDQGERHAREKDLGQQYIAEKKPTFYREEEIARTRETSQEKERDEGRGREWEMGHD